MTVEFVLARSFLAFYDTNRPRGECFFVLFYIAVRKKLGMLLSSTSVRSKLLAITILFVLVRWE